MRYLFFACVFCLQIFKSNSQANNNYVFKRSDTVLNKLSDTSIIKNNYLIKSQKLRKTGVVLLASSLSIAAINQLFIPTTTNNNTVNLSLAVVSGVGILTSLGYIFKSNHYKNKALSFGLKNEQAYLFFPNANIVYENFTAVKLSLSL